MRWCVDHIFRARSRAGAEIRKLMENNEYDPETYSHNCKPVGIRHYPGPNGDEKSYRTEFRSIMGAPVTYR